MSRPDRRPRRSAIPALCAALAALALLLALAPAAGARTVHFAGRSVAVPHSWPVYRLARHPGMCVRLDRRAVYLGTPAANQRCPADAMGRRRAVLVEPAAGGQRRAGAAMATASALSAPAKSSAAAPSGIFTGLGFDACSAPSSRAMAAWSSSPYRALGVYIGGANRGCSQPNLTASWVSAQTAAGWHLIPTYVGLQAPTSSCGSCAKISSAIAGGQGGAAASDAVTQAAAIGIGPGSPIYFDMESYTPGTSATAATLSFLSSWTAKLHSLGYASGVYSSSSSGIADIGDSSGNSLYTEPDALWIANWNGQQNTLDPNLPSNAWSLHQRLHQYQGGHDETYGGTTINIDNDYLDGPTVGTATAPPAESEPVGGLDLAGSPSPGQVRIKGWALDPTAPTEPLAIRMVVGGKEGGSGALQYDLGEIATQSHPGLGVRYHGAGPNHGFDITVPTTKSGRQQVCAYALDQTTGGQTLLGCKTIGIGVAITLSNLRVNGNAVRVRIACAWPTGTECPGQLLLRTRYRAAAGRHRVRVVTRSLGRRSFHLSGLQAHAFKLGLTPGGRALLRARGGLKAQLIAAIPGGRRVATIGLGHLAR